MIADAMLRTAEEAEQRYLGATSALPAFYVLIGELRFEPTLA
jgi:hypothetical protein